MSTHAYFPSGDLASVAHNDNGVTPGFSRTYRRDGSLRTVTDAAGTRTIAYGNAVGARPSGESYAGGVLDGAGLAWPETLGRRTDFVATAALGGPALQSISYGYDAHGRLATVASPDLSATYAYHPGSSLIASIQHAPAAGAGVNVTATRQYDTLDRLQSIAYTAGSSTTSAAVVSSHAYTYDAAHRRTRATRDDGTHWQYGYNARDEVTSATKHLSGSGQMLAGWQQSFAYDNIGNCPFASRNDLESRFAECEPLIAACQCTSATEGGDANGNNRRTLNYSTTNLNTYASIQRSGGGFDVLGRARASALVTVNGQALGAADRQGEHCPSTSRNDLETGSASLRESLSASAPCQWRKELSADNSDAPAFVPVEASATRPGVGVNGQAVTSTQAGGVFIDPASLAPQHDPDGNLIADGRWHYAWDADNKLREMQTHPAAIQAGAPRERYQFTYDSGWRRIRQIVSRWTPGAGANGADDWVVVRDERTVYDEWNPVAQIDAAGNVVQRHLWGIDLSGTAQGAGGVGGLLGTWDNGKTTRDGSRPGDGVARAWACAYDGNGNVSAVIQIGTGNGGTGNQSNPRAARFDYDAFGKTLAAWGDAALGEANRYRFSTKPEDGTGLLYYGYRYLDSRMGRWVSRDPIGENGGININLFIQNSPPKYFDPLGLEVAAPQQSGTGHPNGTIPQNHHQNPTKPSSPPAGGSGASPLSSASIFVIISKLARDAEEMRKVSVAFSSRQLSIQRERIMWIERGFREAYERDPLDALIRDSVQRELDTTREKTIFFDQKNPAYNPRSAPDSVMDKIAERKLCCTEFATKCRKTDKCRYIYFRRKQPPGVSFKNLPGIFQGALAQAVADYGLYSGPGRSITINNAFHAGLLCEVEDGYEFVFDNNIPWGISRFAWENRVYWVLDVFNPPGEVTFRGVVQTLQGEIGVVDTPGELLQKANLGYSQ